MRRGRVDKFVPLGFVWICVASVGAQTFRVVGVGNRGSVCAILHKKMAFRVVGVGNGG